MSWEDVLKEDFRSVGATNPNKGTYTKEELKDLDDVVVSNGETAREYAEGFGEAFKDEFLPDIISMMEKQEFDTLTWVTNDVRTIAYKSVMEVLKYHLAEYFNLEKLP